MFDAARSISQFKSAYYQETYRSYNEILQC